MTPSVWNCPGRWAAERVAKKYPQTADQVAALSLDGVNAEINRLRVAYEDAEAPADRQALFDRLLWVEAEREALHMIPAKPRTFSARKGHGRPTPAVPEPAAVDPESSEFDQDP